jgi:Xaa-Pro aminopeptidase
MKMKTQNRLLKLRQKLAEKNIEAIFLSEPDNLFYLSGCEGLEGYLLITETRAIIVTDFRYVEQARKRSPDWEVFRYSGKMSGWLPILLSDVKIKCLGFENNHLPVATCEQIKEILEQNQMPVNLRPVNGLMNELRSVKEPEEIKLIARAVKQTDAVFKYIEKILKPGLTEKALAWEIEKYLREHGSQPVPFELIVAAGPNAALPHARPSDYVIQKSEPVMIDIGAKFGHYSSDLTRTFYLGKRPGTYDKVYDTVLEAQVTTITQIKPGMTGAEVDEIARNIIAFNGYGEAFGHGLGHGIGLAVHECPRLGPTSTDVLENGMVFTVEPGIYLSGWGGVRIEDDVVLENGRARVLSTARKMLKL